MKVILNAKKIKTLMTEQGIRQRDIYRHFRNSRQLTWSIINGGSIKHAPKLAKLLNIDDPKELIKILM